MSDEKTQSAAEPAKPDERTQAAWSVPFQKMMEEMMARWGCRPEQMGAMWTACCGQPLEKKENHTDL